jgi:hypothetical protein
MTAFAPGVGTVAPGLYGRARVRPDAEFEAVQQLIRAGLNDCAISRATGIPRGTVRDWRHQGDRNKRDSRARMRTAPRWNTGGCPLCDDAPLDRAWYAYLLGLYLGDGCLSAASKGVFKLRVVLDNRYPAIIEECARAMVTMRPGRPKQPFFIWKPGCTEVCALWKHWSCLFPQHAPGRKHLRPILLEWWQRRIAEEHPDRLLRGLIHSDGCRDLNVVNKKSYPRYQFSNESDDVRGIFIDACEAVGLHWTTPTYSVVSISRRADVERLDTFIGPKLAPASIDPGSVAAPVAARFKWGRA